MVLWRLLKQPAVDGLCIGSAVDESEQVTTPRKGFRGLISLFKLIKTRYEIEVKAKKKTLPACANEWDIKGFVDLMGWRCDQGFIGVCSQLSARAKTITSSSTMVRVMQQEDASEEEKTCSLDGR